jgi:hypothetical protein
MSQGNSNGFVRVMRSHDYNQFEVCLPLPERGPGWKSVDDVRKEAARLVDKAVHQFDQHKRALALAERLSGDDGAKLQQDYDEIMKYPQDTWTPRQKAVVASMRQKEWLEGRHSHEYDYEDEAPEFDDTDVAF